jgi:predicted RNA-binding Zn-ribbon protein involved in translation (DUF1610 family)
MITYHTERIKCPECGHEQRATVVHCWPWNAHIHDCEKCGYTIMESDWNTVKEEEQ